MTSQMHKQRIAIAGATGYIGGRLAPRLLKAGYAVRCLVRSTGKLEGRSWAEDPEAQDRLEIKQTDLSDLASLTAALKDCDVAYYLVHSMMSAAGGYAEQDRELAKNFAQASRDAGV